MSFIKDILRFVNELEEEVKNPGEFVDAYFGLDGNDGDISDWHTTHFEDSVEMGFDAGEISARLHILAALKQIIENNS